MNYKTKTLWFYSEYAQWKLDGCNINTNVVRLYLINEKLIHLSEFINNLVNLQVLHYADNGIFYLPKSINKLINLIGLNISLINLHYLPKYNNLINLQYFNCSNNILTKLPEIIGNYINLKYFDCSNNELTKLPKTLGKLVNLQYFDCSKNELTYLPKSINNLINLQHLNCSKNKITNLSTTLIKLKNLEYIRFDEFIYMSSILGRFINKINKMYKINVHNKFIQISLLDSINNLLIESSTTKFNVVEDNILDNKTKNLIFNFIEDKTVSDLLVNFEELLVYILQKIEN